MHRSSKIKLEIGFILTLSLILGISNHHNTYATSSVAITVPASIDLTILPNDNGNTSISTNELSIKTAQTEGFRILVNGNSNTLTNKHHSEVISSITANTILGNLPTNSFGIYLGATSPNSSSTFSPLSTTPTELVHNELANASGTYKLAIGAKVDTSLPAGLYSNELVISVVADPVKVFSGITYMQDMTSDICAAAEENDTMQLIDKRDGKSYWVAKLKDGNCWMVQNLALDLSTDKALTSEDSDVTEDYVPTSDMNSDDLIGDGNNVPDYYQYSWSFGDAVSALPFLNISCSAYSKDTLGEACGASGFIDITDEWRPTFAAQMGNYSYSTSTKTLTTEPNNSGSTLIAADTTSKTYDSHYLVGNYYMWNAATAGSGQNITTNNGKAASSICPRGWRLPTAEQQSDYYPSASGEYWKLLQAYGYPDLGSYSGKWETKYTAMLSYDKNVEDNIVAAPMHLVRTGYVWLPVDYLSDVGSRSFYTGATGLKINGVSYYNSNLEINGTSISPAALNYREAGQSIRCLVK